jgi:hypothetical protein
MRGDRAAARHARYPVDALAAEGDQHFARKRLAAARLDVPLDSWEGLAIRLAKCRTPRPTALAPVMASPKGSS